MYNYANCCYQEATVRCTNSLESCSVSVCTLAHTVIVARRSAQVASREGAGGGQGQAGDADERAGDATSRLRRAARRVRAATAAPRQAGGRPRQPRDTLAGQVRPRRRRPFSPSCLVFVWSSVVVLEELTIYSSCRSVLFDMMPTKFHREKMLQFDFVFQDRKATEREVRPQQRAPGNNQVTQYADTVHERDIQG